MNKFFEIRNIEILSESERLLKNKKNNKFQRTEVRWFKNNASKTWVLSVFWAEQLLRKLANFCLNCCQNYMKLETVNQAVVFREKFTHHQINNGQSWQEEEWHALKEHFRYNTCFETIMNWKFSLTFFLIGVTVHSCFTPIWPSTPDVTKRTIFGKYCLNDKQRLIYFRCAPQKHSRGMPWVVNKLETKLLIYSIINH